MILLMRHFILFILFCTLFELSRQTDPLKEFCRLFGHQTAVVDRQLYIDGGFIERGPITANSINYTNTWFKRGSLDDNNQGFPQQYVLAKNDTIPSVVGGVLWPDEANKLVYLYGGEYGNEKPEPFQMWLYDIIYNTWNVTESNAKDVRRAAWGGGATAQDKALGFYYGGWITSNSEPYYTSTTALSTMLIYDMLADSFHYESGPDNTPRAEGVMLYLPAGDSGLLVYFGGLQQPYGNSTIEGVSMTDIFIYSIGDNKWDTEKATGDIPDKRRRFCAGVAWSDDRTSYNIYLYGGASVGDGFGFGDVYILSLPSFRWIKFYTSSDVGFDNKTTKHSATCNVIGNSQMIVMGGFSTQSSECDQPSVYGQHGLDLGKANPDRAKWAVFNASITTYQVPPEITKTIGGGGTGGATALSPSSGWANSVMQVNFQKSYTPSVRNPTRPLATATPSVNSSSTTSSAKASGISSSRSSHRKTTIGAAVGGTIGGLLVLVALGYCAYSCRKKRKQSEQNRNGGERSHPRPPSEIPAAIKAPTPPNQWPPYHSPVIAESSIPNGSFSPGTSSLVPQELSTVSSPVHTRHVSNPQISPSSPHSSHTDSWFIMNPPKA